ncbi:MAG: hypothetical protein K9G63_17960 [Melioribacteraceae bacterium]|nr:hypothetical protein [Melioribacteraceae bacterium]
MVDLDNFEIDFECPQCSFINDFYFKQARLRDVIICRGCKANIHLDDHMNECKIARRQINRALQNLEDSISNLNLTIKL